MALHMRCELVSWQRVHALCRRLAGQIRADSFRPDVIVAIARGGYMPARLLCDYLDITALTSFKIEHYVKGADKQRAAVLREPLSRDVRGLRVLVVDDVNDSGDTLQLARDHVGAAAPAELRIAVLHHKIVSHARPDYLAQRVVRWRWIIYPWAVMEDLTGFVRRMPERPATPEALAARLAEQYALRVPRALLMDVLELTTPESEAIPAQHAAVATP